MRADPAGTAEWAVPKYFSLTQNFSDSQNGACSPERYLGRTCLKGTFLKEEADAKTTRRSRVFKLTKREKIERGAEPNT